MKKFFLAICIASVGLLSACSTRPTAEENHTGQVKDIRNELKYFKDAHGLCYAYTGMVGDRNFAFTTVPCGSIPPGELIP